MPEYMRQARDIRRAAIELDAEPPRRWAGPGEVVVSRTDLEWAVGMIEDEWTGERGMLLHPDHDPIYARLRAVLNTENQT